MGLRPKGSARFSSVRDGDSSGGQTSGGSPTLWIDFQDVTVCSASAAVATSSVANRLERPGCPKGLNGTDLKLTCVIDLTVILKFSVLKRSGEAHSSPFIFCLLSGR